MLDWEEGERVCSLRPGRAADRDGVMVRCEYCRCTSSQERKQDECVRRSSVVGI